MLPIYNFTLFYYSETPYEKMLIIQKIELS